MQISVWERESFYAPKDVIIVGSGLVGLWCAWYLKKKDPKCRIAIVDRGIIPTGASTRNAGFACFGSVTELVADTRKSGADAMLDLVEMRFKGLESIRKVFGDKRIDYENCGGFELITTHNNPGKAALENHMDVLNNKLQPIVGTKNTFRFVDKKIASFGFGNTAHLIENKLEGALHSGKLCQALLQEVQGAGVTVLNGVEITSFEKIGDQVVLYTNQHFHLTTQKMLICTNAFAKELIPELDIVPARGQVLVTSPIPHLAIKGTFHYDEGFYYFRHLGNRLLLGGARNKAVEEETTTVMETTEKIQQELEDFLANYLLPGKQYTITDRWSGIMGMGGEKMPIIRETSPGVFCAVRMSGMGVALAAMVGEKMAKMLR